MRNRVDVVGTISSMTFPGVGRPPVLKVDFAADELVYVLSFLGRTDMTCLEVGSQLRVRGTVTNNHGVPTIFNPNYTVIASGV